MLENLGGDKAAHARWVGGKRCSIKATIGRFSDGLLSVRVSTMMWKRPDVVPSRIEDWPTHMAEFIDVVEV